MKLNKIIMMLGLALLLGSCKSDEPMTPQQTRGIEVPVSFTLCLATEEGSTRDGENNPDGSVWDKGENDPQDGGTAFDNKINSVIPVVYAVNGNKMETSSTVATMTYTEKMEPAKDDLGEDIKGRYILKGIMTCTNTTEQQLLEGNYRLALFINCDEGDVANKLLPTKPAAAKFYHHGIPGDMRDAALGGNKSFNSIPMYGVTNIKFTNPGGILTVKAGDGVSDISVDALRSMAKVRVALGDLDNVKLKSLSMTRHAEQGYVCPKSWNSISSVSDLTLGSAMRADIATIAYNSNCITYAPASDPTGDDASWKNSSTRLRFYLPDTYNNVNDKVTGSEEIALTIVYDIIDSNGTAHEKTHNLYFRPFKQWPEDGVYPAEAEGKNPWDIIRNHIYEFIITGVEPTTGALRVEVALKKWVRHDLSDKYEIDVPDYYPGDEPPAAN